MNEAQNMGGLFDRKHIVSKETEKSLLDIENDMAKVNDILAKINDSVDTTNKVIRDIESEKELLGETGDKLLQEFRGMLQESESKAELLLTSLDQLKSRHDEYMKSIDFGKTIN